MKIKQINFLIKEGSFGKSNELQTISEEIVKAIRSVAWPTDSDRFTLYPIKQANGVVPIKKNCMSYLKDKGWSLEYRVAIASRLRPGPLDAVKILQDGRLFAVEWETGNISSSHRALNKIAIGLIDGKLAGGILILPSREMYRYLTDRIGNYAEIEPYFPVWRNLQITEGSLAVIEIEHDDISMDVMPIKKGTDGRALR